MKLTEFKAAIFDLDGTLVLSEPAWEEAKRRVLARHGVEVPQPVYDAFVGRGLRGFLTEVMGPGLSDARRTDLANQIGAEADILLPQMRRIVPGASEFVQRVAQAGLGIAVCSSSPSRHIVAALDQLGLSGLVPIQVSGAELPRGKPDPLPYLETLRRLRVGAKEAFAVEDALPGVRSAHAAGLTVIGIGQDACRPDFAELCRLRVPDYPELNRIFDLP